MMNFDQFKYSCRVKAYKTKRMKNKSNAKQNNDKVLRPFIILTHSGSYIMHWQDKYYSHLENHSELRVNECTATPFYALDITVTMTIFFIVIETILHFFVSYPLVRYPQFI